MVCLLTITDEIKKNRGVNVTVSVSIQRFINFLREEEREYVWDLSGDGKKVIFIK